MSNSGKKGKFGIAYKDSQVLGTTSHMNHGLQLPSLMPSPLESTYSIQGVAIGDRTHLGIYASKYYGVSQTRD